MADAWKNRRAGRYKGEDVVVGRCMCLQGMLDIDMSILAIVSKYRRPRCKLEQQSAKADHKQFDAKSRGIDPTWGSLTRARLS